MYAVDCHTFAVIPCLYVRTKNNYTVTGFDLTRFPVVQINKRLLTFTRTFTAEIRVYNFKLHRASDTLTHFPKRDPSVYSSISSISAKFSHMSHKNQETVLVLFFD